MRWTTRTPIQPLYRGACSAHLLRDGCRTFLGLVLTLAAGVGLGQENPLRDAAFGSHAGSPVESGTESGYLEQLLPSLQKLQDEVPPATGPANAMRVPAAAPQPRRFPGAEDTQTVQGTLAVGGSPAAGDAMSAASQTQTRLADNRFTTDLPDFAAANSATEPRAAAEARGAETSGSTPKGNVSPTGGWGRSPSGLSQSAGGRLSAFQGVESLQLNSTMVKVGLNTLLVLAASIGLILVVRKTWPKPAANQPRSVGRLQIEQTLSLGGKAELKVVRCGLNQVLVAIDGGGIRSVVALEPALETEREHVEPVPANAPPAAIKEPVNIEQFVKMIKDMEGDFMAARTGR